MQSLFNFIQDFSAHFPLAAWFPPPALCLFLPPSVFSEEEASKLFLMLIMFQFAISEQCYSGNPSAQFRADSQQQILFLAI